MNSYTIPPRWFPIHYWATDTLRNILAHRPELTPILLEMDLTQPVTFVVTRQGGTSLEYSSDKDRESTPLLPARNASNSSTKYKQNSFFTSRRRRFSSACSNTSIRSRLEIYIEEATKRAEELEQCVKEWERCRSDSFVLPELLPVEDTASWDMSLTFVGYGGMDGLCLSPKIIV